MEAHHRLNGAHAMEESKTSSTAPRMTLPTPLFERLVTEEVQELKAYARIIENQTKRLSELERVHGDLENRLEHETRERAQLETTLERREREWATRFKELEASRDEWRKKVDAEKNEIERHKKMISKLEQHIQKMLQRKYDKTGDAQNAGQPFRNQRHVGNDRQPAGMAHLGNAQEAFARGAGSEAHHFQSPHDILAANGSIEVIRNRDVQNLLTEFFAI